MLSAIDNGLPPRGKYRAVNIQRFPGGDGLELAVREQDHVAVVVRPEIAAALQSCQSFAPLEAHAATFRRVFRGSALEALDATGFCRELCRAGLLEPEEAFVERCRLAAVPQRASTNGVIRTFGWITCERPDALRRSVTSYLDNAGVHDRAVEAVVVDGSLNPEACLRNQELLRRIARAAGIDLRYAGPADRAAYGAALAARGDIPGPLLDFALGDPHGCGCAIGANRNALLLDTLGDLVLSADDDTICRPTAHPSAGDGLSLYGRRDPTDLWSFEDRRSALAFAPPANVDIAAVHEMALGHSLSMLVRDCLTSKRLQWGQLPVEDVRMLEAGTGQVTVTFTGVLGDSGMATHSGLLWGLHEPSRSRVLGNATTYRTALESRELLRVSPMLAAGASSHCMGGAFGFDNRSVLPPFMPVRRNEDSLFGALLRACRDDAVFAHLPIAVLHDAAPRTSRLCVESPFARRSLGDALMFAILSHPRSPGRQPCAKRLHQLGAHLQEVGALPTNDLERLLRVHLAAQASLFFATLDWVRRQYGPQPAHCAADIAACAQEARELLQHPDAIVPGDLAARRRSRSDVLTLTRDLIKRFGELLSAWPHILSTARDLRQSGVRLSQSL